MAHELPKTVATVLIGASEIIRKRGWCRGTLINDEGEVCLLSAIFIASTGMPAECFYSQKDHDELTVRAWGVVEDLLNARNDGFGTLTIPGWNDMPSRVVGDVYQILDDAVSVALFA